MYPNLQVSATQETEGVVVKAAATRTAENQGAVVVVDTVVIVNVQEWLVLDRVRHRREQKRDIGKPGKKNANFVGKSWALLLLPSVAWF